MELQIKANRNGRLLSNVLWNPEVVKRWCKAQGNIALTWLSDTVGQHRTYLHKAAQQGSINPEVLDKLVDLTGIQRSVILDRALTEEQIDEYLKMNNLVSKKVVQPVPKQRTQKPVVEKELPTDSDFMSKVLDMCAAKMRTGGTSIQVYDLIQLAADYMRK